MDSTEDQEWQICLQRARQLGLEAVRLAADQIDHELVESMPYELLSNYRVLPLSRRGFELVLAMADPLVGSTSGGEGNKKKTAAACLRDSI